MAVQEKTATIRDVAARQTRSGDIYVVTDTTGTDYSTFNRALAEQARQLTGQTVRMRYTEKEVHKDGRSFTNRYYEGAEPGGGFGNDSFGGGFNGASSGNLTPQLPAPAQESDREIKIVRQSCLKAAVHTLGYLPDQERTPRAALEIAEFYLRYVFEGHAVDALPVGAQDDIPF